MRFQHTHFSQRGVAMVISLVMLLLVSIVVLQAARSSNLELLIGNNTQQSTTALMRAENSVLVGETVVENNFIGAPLNFNFAREGDGFYLEDDLDLQTTDWSELGTEVVGSGYNKFEYVVEYIGSEIATGSSLGVGAGGSGSNLIYLYRVSGRGDAGIGGARVVQTIYATAD